MEETDHPRVTEPAPILRQNSDPGLSLPAVVEELAQIVAVSGDELEDIARERNKNTLELGFLHDKYSALYRNYRSRVIELKKGVDSQIQSQPEDISKSESAEPKRKRKSRWGNKDQSVPAPVMASPSIGGVGGPGVALPTALGSSVSPMVTGSTQSGLTPARAANSSLLAYAQRVFGSVNLDEAQWKQCEDQLKVRLCLQNMIIQSNSLHRWQLFTPSWRLSRSRRGSRKISGPRLEKWSMTATRTPRMAPGNTRSVFQDFKTFYSMYIRAFT